MNVVKFVQFIQRVKFVQFVKVVKFAMSVTFVMFLKFVKIREDCEVCVPRQVVQLFEQLCIRVELDGPRILLAWGC